MALKTVAIRLLALHESQDNAERIVNTLKNAGIATRPELVGDMDGLLNALKDGTWDIFLAGETTNSISYKSAIEQIRKLSIDIPAIVLLEKYNQEIITEAMQQGAADAVVFNAYKHLMLVIEREFANLQHRRARRIAEASLAESEKRCELLIDNSRDAIAYVHDGMHIYVNSAYVELFGYASIEDMEGMPVIDLVTHEDLNSFKEYLRAYIKGESISQDLHFHGIKADGGKIDAMMRLSAASYDGESCTQIIIHHDDTASNAALVAEELKKAASIDMLTGLANRQYFEEILRDAVHKAHRDKSRSTLFFCAIDNMNQVVAEAGLPGADAVVKAVAVLLSRNFPSVPVARFRDTAFTAMIPGIDIESARAKAEALCQSAYDHLIQLPDGKTYQATLSIGISMIGETAPNPSEILTRAIGASEKVRLDKGNGVQVFNIAEQASSSDSALLELLVDALDNNKFKLLYQPLISVDGGAGEFYEVFVRLPLADGKMMTPDEFMSVAQKHRLGARIDRWVMLNAARQLHAHHAPNARLLLNLTAESLQDNTLAPWIGKLSKAIDPQGNPIVLQFAESDVVDYLKIASEQTHALNQVGCPVSICHFGTSLNPLNTLKHVAASQIKLDRSFTQDLNNEENMGAIKKLTEELRSLDKQVIVSFVENAQALSKLWTLGVQYLQGYYLQPPGDSLHYEVQN